MKKTFKTIGAFAACVPVAALAACGLKPAQNPAATRNDFAAKYTAAYEALTAGDAFLEIYDVLSISADGEKGTYRQNTVTAADYEIQKGSLVKAALSSSEEASAKIGEDTPSQKINIEKYVKDGMIYLCQTTKNNDQTEQTTSVEPLSAEDAALSFETLFFFPDETFIENFLTAEELTVKCNKNNTQMELSAPIDLAAFEAILTEISVVMGEYEYDYETLMTYTVRFDNAGNLLYFETEFTCKAKALAPVQAEENTESGETTENGENTESEETPVPEAPSDQATVTQRTRVTVKDASTVKLPSQSYLDAFKKENVPSEETPDNENTDGE